MIDNHDDERDDDWDPLAMRKDKQIMSYMAMGYAPSEIDKKLRLSEGEAHDIVCAYWRSHT